MPYLINTFHLEHVANSGAKIPLMVCLIDAIFTSHALVEVNLCKCFLGDRGANAIATYLATNTTLKSLNLII